MDAKEVAARKAVEYVKDGMTLGLGSGSTATHAIRFIGERVKNEGLRVRGIPTSGRSRELAEELGIPLTDFAEVSELDLTIDGADETDTRLNLIKGGGGALLREKIVASASRERIIICDESKLHTTLGTFPLPLVVTPFGWESTRRLLARFGGTITLRETQEGKPFLTDDGLYIVDMHLGRILDPVALERNLKEIVGVLEVGLFVGMTSRLIVGYTDGRIEEILPPI